MTSGITAPLDAGRWAFMLTALLARIQDPSMRYLDCGSGWYPILARLEQEFALRRPNTVLRCVRERDGDLVVDVIDSDEVAEGIIAVAAETAARTCELTGAEGLAMVGASGRRILNPVTAPPGWRIDMNPLRLGVAEQNAVLLRFLIEARTVIDPGTRD
jgi:hypothetical protein